MVKFSLFLICFIGVHAEQCDTIAVAANGGWKPVKSAPRDGTTVEMLETYGVAPHYGLYKWTADSLGQGWQWDYDPAAKDAKPSWKSVDRPGIGHMENKCLFWRPYKGTGKYVDPTGGAQYTVAYECAWMHIPYDAKTGYCKP